MAYRMGIDLGGSSVKLGLVDGEYRIAKRLEVPLGDDLSFPTVMDAIEGGVNALRGTEEILSAGIGVPTTVLDRRIAVKTPNMGWVNRDVGSEMARRFDFPCTVDNDADCAAMAEHVAGAGRGRRSMAMITLGSGVGSSIVYDGRILRGHRDCGVEFGHLKIVADGRLCGCGSRGCAEAYCSATSLKADIAEAVRAKRGTVLKEWMGQPGVRPGAKLVFDAARMGDAVGQALLRRYIAHLAVLVSNVILCYRPDVVVIGGGISAAGDALFGPLNAQLEDLTYGAEMTGYPVAIPATLGNDAGIIGAANMEGIA